MFQYIFKKFILLCFFITFSIVSLPHQAYAAENINITKLINIAGSQRMLTQRMLKAYCLKGMYITPLKSKKQLDASILRFSKQLELLESFSKAQGYTEAVTTGRHRWDLVKTLVLQTPKKENAITLRERTEKLLQQSEVFVAKLKEISGSHYGVLVAKSGRQRMLSQRIASLYMLQAWGIKNAMFSHDNEVAVREFEVTMEELSNAEENTTTIQDKLDQVSALWRVYKLVTNVDHDSTASLESFKLELVSDSADHILSLMNDITEMYEKL